MQSSAGDGGQPELLEAHSAAEFAVGRVLFEEYAAQLGVDLCFQNFAAELERLPQMYGAPSGCLLLARQNGSEVGCGAVRHLSGTVCEMKRLYVKPPLRGSGLGRRLAVGLIDKGIALGYTHMVLDTLKTMTAALRLYHSLGFREIPAYYANPMPEVAYLERVLTGGSGAHLGQK